MRPARSINGPMDKMRKASLRKRKGQNVTSCTGCTHTQLDLMCNRFKVEICEKVIFSAGTELGIRNYGKQGHLGVLFLYESQISHFWPDLI